MANKRLAKGQNNLLSAAILPSYSSTNTKFNNKQLDMITKELEKCQHAEWAARIAHEAALDAVIAAEWAASHFFITIATQMRSENKITNQGSKKDISHKTAPVKKEEKK